MTTGLVFPYILVYAYCNVSNQPIYNCFRLSGSPLIPTDIELDHWTLGLLLHPHQNSDGLYGFAGCWSFAIHWPIDVLDIMIMVL